MQSGAVACRQPVQDGAPTTVRAGSIRHTSLSIPYHLGNGWFGGFLPLISASLLAATGNMYAGLIYPIGVALISLVVGSQLIKESRHVRIWDEVGGREMEPEAAPAAAV